MTMVHPLHKIIVLYVVAGSSIYIPINTKWIVGLPVMFNKKYETYRVYQVLLAQRPKLSFLFVVYN